MFSLCTDSLVQPGLLLESITHRFCILATQSFLHNRGNDVFRLFIFTNLAVYCAFTPSSSWLSIMGHVCMGRLIYVRVNSVFLPPLCRRVIIDVDTPEGLKVVVDQAPSGEVQVEHETPPDDAPEILDGQTSDDAASRTSHSPGNQLPPTLFWLFPVPPKFPYWTVAFFEPYDGMPFSQVLSSRDLYPWCSIGFPDCLARWGRSLGKWNRRGKPKWQWNRSVAPAPRWDPLRAAHANGYYRHTKSTAINLATPFSPFGYFSPTSLRMSGISYANNRLFDAQTNVFNSRLISL